MLHQHWRECRQTIYESIKILTSKFRNYKNEHEQIKRKFLKIQESYDEKKKNELLVGGKEKNSNKVAQRQKLIENEDIAWDQNDKIIEAKRKTQEIEGMQEGIVSDLESQTDKLKNVNRNVVDISEELHFSNSLMTRLLKRENRNKILIGFAVGVILIIVIIIICVKLAQYIINI